MLTKQEIFDTVYNGLAAQGFKQSVDTVGCSYRGRDDTKCAFGHLIPDEQYSSFLENESARRLLNGSTIEYYKSQIIGLEPEDEWHSTYNKKIAFFTKFKEWSDTVFSTEDIGLVQALQEIHDVNTKPENMKSELETFKTNYITE